MNIEFVRDCLFRAFLIPSSGTGLVVDNVRETRRSASDFLRRPSHKIQLEDRTVRVPAEAVHVSETRRYKSGKIPLLPTAFDDVAWIRAVRESAPIHAAWLKYCYDDDLCWNGQMELVSYVWERFSREAERYDVKPDVFSAMQRLVWLSVQTAKRLAVRGESIFTDNELAGILGIHKTVFSRRMKPHWTRMVSHVTRLDYEALANAERCHKSREPG